MNKERIYQKIARFHDKNYKLLLLIPLALLIFSLVYMVQFYEKNDALFNRDISLTGGTSVTINDKINSEELRQAISNKLEGVNVREVSDLISREELAVIVETKSGEAETREVLEEFLGYELTPENSSFEFSGETLSKGFYKQLLIAISVSFLLMSLVVFFQFKSIVHSLAVIYSAFADIIMALVVVNLLGIEISSAGIVAFLMLIGYSVDTDILLANKVLNRKGKSVNRVIFESFKTGMTMTFTSLFAVMAAFLIVGPFSSVLYQIFLIMMLGLSFDLMNTWLTNVSITKWHALHKESKSKKQNEN
ncbi:MAG TPA: efflux RND transporter permease subunit [Candidatus Pacearchaeota archaeon]|nr:efflux RND transporter permease subunit [Candidatus Pacearchaeota archaeon]